MKIQEIGETLDALCAPGHCMWLNFDKDVGVYRTSFDGVYAVVTRRPKEGGGNMFFFGDYATSTKEQDDWDECVDACTLESSFEALFSTIYEKMQPVDRCIMLDRLLSEWRVAIENNPGAAMVTREELDRNNC